MAEKLNSLVNAGVSPNGAGPYDPKELLEILELLNNSGWAIQTLECYDRALEKYPLLTEYSVIGMDAREEEFHYHGSSEQANALVGQKIGRAIESGRDVEYMLWLDRTN